MKTFWNIWNTEFGLLLFIFIFFVIDLFSETQLIQITSTLILET